MNLNLYLIVQILSFLNSYFQSDKFSDSWYLEILFKIQSIMNKILFVFICLMIIPTLNMYSQIKVRGESSCCVGPNCQNDSPPPVPDPTCIGCLSIIVEVIGSYDPNDIIPPNSCGEEGWIRKDRNLGFTVQFENDPDMATAAAQRVEVIVPFDETVVDMNSIKIGDVAFGEFSFQLPPNVQSYSDTFKVANTLGVDVVFEANLDLVNAEAKWIFQSIDPITKLPPTDPFAGFLPVNNPDIHNGEGLINFSFNPNSNVQTFDEIDSYANIFFDLNDPIMTPMALNTIDNDDPISTISQEVTAPSINQLKIDWSGTDVGCGLQNYTLFVSENGADYEPWLIETDSTSGLLDATIGNTYRIISIARDSLLNVEEKVDFDLEITFTEDLLQTASISARTFLQGPFDNTTGFMKDQLRVNNLIPLVEPYSALGYTSVIGGGETMDVSLLDIEGDDAIIDWLFLEIMDADDPSLVLATKCVLLQADGDLMDHDGNTLISIDGIDNGTYYLGIHHRNHLPVYTATAIAFSPITTIDFTLSSTATSGVNALFDNTSEMLMWAGDANGDGSIIYAGSGTDVNEISSLVFTNLANPLFSPTIPVSGYHTADVNMDGMVIYAGFGTDVNNISSAVFQNPANTGFSPTFVLEGQIIE